MTSKATSTKGKPKKLAVKRQTIQDLSPSKSVAQKVKGGSGVVGVNDGGGKWGVMASGC